MHVPITLIEGHRIQYVGYCTASMCTCTCVDVTTVLVTIFEPGHYITPLYLHVPLSPDVQFWRNRKSLEGLSVRSVFFNVFQSFVVLLYILDNETNFVIIVSVFIGEPV